MKFAFRADASTRIGTGHIMRCLALADTLKRRGSSCHFICLQETGRLLDLIRAHGHTTHDLVGAEDDAPGADWVGDVAQTRAIVAVIQPDWLIVDHYRLGREWECEIRSAAGKLFAIDDIGRAHQCDLLLDQNFRNPVHARYRETQASGTQVLLGPEYALVSSRFAALRPAALGRRDRSLSRLLVTMGGTDPDNETGKVLAGLGSAGGSRWVVDVVVGASNPHVEAVEAVCRNLPNATLHVQTSKMAELMLAADCAIAAGGSTTWERCCLGLPALVTVISDDQLAIAEAVAATGAHLLLGRNRNLRAEDYVTTIGTLTPERLRTMSAAAAAICDGLGAERVAERLH